MNLSTFPLFQHHSSHNHHPEDMKSERYILKFIFDKKREIRFKEKRNVCYRANIINAWISQLFRSSNLIFSCPKQLNRWPCHSLTQPPFKKHNNRAILETCDLWDIWSGWWGDMTWPKSLNFLDFFVELWGL